MEVDCQTFDKVIPGHENEFIYADPPYFTSDSEDNKMFKNIYPNSNFAIHHNHFDHHKLRELLDNHKGKFILSYNNCKEIREMYSGYEQVFPKWQYSFGQGETRIGKNKDNNDPKESHEILIIKS
jgi:DNA adenine methylase